MTPAVPLPKGLRHFLTRIAASEDGELVYEKGAGWWIGTEKVHGKWPRMAISLVLVTLSSGPAGEYPERWVLNEDGTGLISDARYQPKMLRILRGREVR